MKFQQIFILVFLVMGFKTTGDQSLFDYKTDFFTLDILGNIYTVHGSELHKYDETLKPLATYGDLSLGDISSVDVSDAMNILVFYEDFAKIVFLDNTLSVKNSIISLTDLGFPNASLACLSYNNAFWIFDPVNQELVRITQFLNISERTGNLNQIIDNEILPDQLFESGDKVFLKDRKKGVFVFDRYGGFISHYPFRNVEFLSLAGEQTMLYLRNDSLFFYNMQTLQAGALKLSQQNVKSFFFTDKRLYFLDNKGRLRATIGR